MPDALTPRPAAATSPKTSGGICANCHAALAPAQKHCHDCGQPAHLHPPSAWEFVHEFIAHYVALEGRLWRTLGALFLQPGKLTLAWLRGERGRYVLPLRLYLTASILFFVLLKLSASWRFDVAAASSLPDKPLRELGAEFRVVGVYLGGGSVERAINDWLRPAEERLKRRMENMRPVEAVAYVSNVMLSNTSYAMFFLLPVYALLLKLAYLTRRLRYGVHLVFAFHVHSFAFLMFLVLMAPMPDLIGLLAFCVVPLHVLLAMHRVYGGSWAGVLARALFIGVPYLIALLLALFGLAGSVLFVT